MNRNIVHKLALLLILILVALTTGCKKAEEGIIVDNTPEPTVEVEVPKDPDEIMKEFYQMINGDESVSNVDLFIDESIENLDKTKADTMILDYESYLTQNLNVLLKDYEIANSNPELSEILDLGLKDNIVNVKDESLKELLNRTIDKGYMVLKGGGYIYPEIDYSSILKYKEYISEEVWDYLEIMDIETKNRFTYGEEIEIPLKELLSRTLKSENYLVNNKGASTSNKIYELYIEYMDASILGNGNPYTLTLDGFGTLKDDIFNEYKEFVNNNKESRTGEILQEYISILEANDKDLDSPEVIEFYDQRYSNIKGKFSDLGL